MSDDHIYHCPVCKTGIIELFDMAELCDDCGWDPDWAKSQYDKTDCDECNPFHGQCCFWKRKLPDGEILIQRVYHIDAEHHRCLCDATRRHNADRLPE